ncbi:MAG: GNAT family N-acetyltransferase [Acidimicrobiia bacterium]|nr:GNAT family N-acetyltransferase [Acidimicrobiia bacterium]
MTIRPGTHALESLSPTVAAEWAALADEAGSDPFSHPEWVGAWGRAFGIDVRLATLRRGTRLVAAYPIVVSGGRGWRAAADWHTPHLDVVGASSAAAGLFDALVASGRRCSFDFATGATADLARNALAGAGLRNRERVRQASPWIDLGGGWEAYRDGIPGKKWREIRRRRRRLEAEGAVAYSQHDGAIGLRELLTEGFAIEDSGWKEASGTAVRSDPRVEAFYRDVAAWAARVGMLRLHFLRLDGRAIAFDLAFVANGAEWLLKTGFDPVVSAFSPGALLRAEVLERAFGEGLARYEFLGTAAPWKLEWTDRTRDVVLCDGFASGIRGRIDEFGARMSRRLRLRLGRSGR